MKDAKWLVIFTAVGLALAYAVSGPLRRRPAEQPRVGTPLHESRLYAEGVVRLAPGLEKAASSAGAFYLFARPPAGGPPVAVKRVVRPFFPLNFTLTTDDSMTGAEFYEGDFRLTARLDQDGAAGPMQAGDIETSLDLKSGGSRQVEIVLKP